MFPEPGKYNSEQSDELLVDIEIALRRYFNDPNLLVHIKNADTIPDVIANIIEHHQRVQSG